MPQSTCSICGEKHTVESPPGLSIDQVETVCDDCEDELNDSGKDRKFVPDSDRQDT